MDKNEYPKPSLTVDAVVIVLGKILLIERKNAPFGWALPGGFVDPGENAEQAVARELKEETGLIAGRIDLAAFASAPDRDPRGWVVSAVYQVTATGTPVAADDAKNVDWFDVDNLPQMAFDHKEIIEGITG